jgi:hypothetical protein
VVPDRPEILRRTAMPNPFATVKQRFESKEKLVEAVKQFISDELWLPRLSSDRGGSKELKHVSNAKLLRLHEVFSEVKEHFGSRAKLIDAILELGQRVKDPGFRARLEAYPVPRLYDLYQTAKKRVASAAKSAKKGAAAAAKPAKKTAK